MKSLPIAGLTLLFSLSLTACGQASETFDDSYVTEFVASCVIESTAGGIPEEMAQSFCECGANRAVEDLTITEKVSPPEDKIAVIMEACIGEIDL